MLKQANNYVSHTIWMILEKLSRIISGVLVGVLVARYLGPTQFGIISYSLNVVAIFTVFSVLGLDGLIVRELLIRPDERNTILGTSFSMRFAGAFFVVAASTF